MSADKTFKLAERVIHAAAKRELWLTTAESCTGGLISGALTDVAGASSVIDRCFVTYSNAAKQDLLGVSAHVLDAYGAVSEETARAMAEGVIARTDADLAIAVTGIAGPGGGSENKPVGLVFLATARRVGDTCISRMEYGDIGRRNVREATVDTALDMLLARLEA